MATTDSLKEFSPEIYFTHVFVFIQKVTKIKNFFCYSQLHSSLQNCSFKKSAGCGEILKNKNKTKIIKFLDFYSFDFFMKRLTQCLIHLFYKNQAYKNIRLQNR